MGILGISDQTLEDFIREPFHESNAQKNLEYETRYQKYKRENRIKIEGTMEIDKNYFIHITIPSESQKGLMHYDVVVQFFTPDSSVQKELTLQNYYVQFFSNSPGFIYKYASLYKLQGYLIESLVDKYPEGMTEILPEKANKKFDLYFDSSIYYACRYLIDNKLVLLGKLNFVIRNKTASAFYNGIQDSEEVGIARQVSSFENKLKKEISSDTGLSQKQEIELGRKSEKYQDEIHEIKEKKRAQKSTFRDKSKQSIIKTAKTATPGIIKSRISTKIVKPSKKTHSTTTRRKKT